MSKIVVVAKIKAKKHHDEEVYAELLNLYKNTHAQDEGVVQYELHKDREHLHRYVFIETWENQDYLDAHEQKEHFLASIGKLTGKIENLDISKLEKLDI